MIQTGNIYQENCIETLKRMPDGMLDMTLTSPPYDDLRDFVAQFGKMWGKGGPLERVGLVPFAGADADAAARQAGELKPLDPATLK